MKKNFFAFTFFAFFSFNQAQVGINTSSPNATLDIKGNNIAVPDGIVAPRLTGQQLRAKTYTPVQEGALVYVTVADSAPAGQTINVTDVGYFYFNGTQWISFKTLSNTTTNATRYLGGTIFVRFNTTTAGTTTIPNNRVIGGAVGTIYNVGTVTGQSSSKGGITQIYGSGYTVSNPGQGIYDIKFDVPLKTIYGASLNVFDAYGQGTPGVITLGKDPTTSSPGNILLTTDNSQISFIDNTILRVKTGDGSGNYSNRPFTFLITGQ
ncbi:hypothetical protein [Chryseobacterium sp. c4a]|uniref:hypothetical protein n=1 Tax=Chryseobacterium sp. c4a TaxID=1573582 RepID=UPI001E304355|nr:hypothetical protein [Chryseobacterium sp. c4a]